MKPNPAHVAEVGRMGRELADWMNDRGHEKPNRYRGTAPGTGGTKASSLLPDGPVTAQRAGAQIITVGCCIKFTTLPQLGIPILVWCSCGVSVEIKPRQDLGVPARSWAPRRNTP